MEGCHRRWSPRPPFEVVHVDAHADLGLGDNGYVYLLTELLSRTVENRRDPRIGTSGLNSGNYLAFAIACRWVADLIFVVGGRPEYYWWDDGESTGRPTDLLKLIHKGSNLNADLQLPLLDAQDLRSYGSELDASKVLAREPIVPFHWSYPKSFNDPGPFTYITLAHSPAFTPETVDPLYEEIQRRFIRPI